MDWLIAIRPCGRDAGDKNRGNTYAEVGAVFKGNFEASIEGSTTSQDQSRRSWRSRVTELTAMVDAADIHCTAGRTDERRRHLSAPSSALHDFYLARNRP